MNHDQKMIFDEDQIKFRHPFTFNISGPTGVGKTYLLREILSNYKAVTTINEIKVLWAYGVYQDLYNKPIENVEINYFDGLPTVTDLNGYNVLVLDDLMRECANSTEICDFFLKESHHKNVSIFFITQNLFTKGSVMRDISLNCHYFILLKTRRDLGQIRYFAQQMFGKQTKSFMKVYEDATANAYGYLVVDTRPNSIELVRIRNFIIPGSATKKFSSVSTPILYVLK